MDDRIKLREFFQNFREILAEKEREHLGAMCENLEDFMGELKRDYQIMEQEVVEARHAKRNRILNSQREGSDWHQESNFEGPIDELNAVQKVKTRDYMNDYSQKQDQVFEEMAEIDGFLSKKRPNPLRFPLGRRSIYDSVGKSASKSSRRESRKTSSKHYTSSLPRRYASSEKSDALKPHFTIANTTPGLK
jgi:CRISPR/Cas system-associated endoribonuclease Cas2